MSAKGGCCYAVDKSIKFNHLVNLNRYKLSQREAKFL